MVKTSKIKICKQVFSSVIIKTIKIGTGYFFLSQNIKINSLKVK